MAVGFEIGTDGPSVVVIGVDGSDSSVRAATYAVGMCRRQGSGAVLVHVREAAGPWAVMDSTGMSSTVVVHEQDAVEREIRAALPQIADAGVRACLVVRSGDPYRELSAVAEELRADLVVVGSSATLGRRIAGSIAVRLVRDARVPVTVVP